MKTPPRSWESKFPRIPRLEVDLGGQRGRQPQRFLRHSGQRCSDQCLSGRKAADPGRTIIVRLAWIYVPSEENNKIFGRVQSFVAGPHLPSVDGQGLNKIRRNGRLGYRAIKKQTCRRGRAQNRFRCHEPAKLGTLFVDSGKASEFGFLRGAGSRSYAPPSRPETDGIIATGVNQWNRKNPNCRAKP
jgi:hypothetical protein